MSIEKYKITQIEIDSNNVKSAPNRLIGTAKENKNVFDRLAELTAAKINGIVDTLVSTIDGSSGANNIGSTPLKTGGTTTVQGQLKGLQDDKVDKVNIVQKVTSTKSTTNIPSEKAVLDAIEAITDSSGTLMVFDCGHFDTISARAAHVASLTSHLNMSVDGNNMGRSQQVSSLQEHQVDASAHQNIVLDGNVQGG